MRIGISPFASTRAGTLAVARAAVAGGIDTLWLGDGLLATDDFAGWAGSLEPFVELAWLAGAAGPARVGLSAAVLPLRDIVAVAKQAATLDLVTDGGFVMVVAPGFWAREFEYRRVPFAERGRRLEEAVGALQAAWQGEPFLGPTIELPEGRLSPDPLTPGGPPVWLAGGEATMARALRLGLPFQDSRKLPDALAPVAQRWFAEGGGLLAHRVRVQATDTAPVGREVDWQALAGPAPFLVEQLSRYAALGVADLSVIPGQDDDGSRHTVHVLVDEVLPALREAGVATA